ncbi:hypothetical protein [Kitasatospora cineracea]|uniref:hypothetical protein n=1 Tax=Kitasatospora cineracea TaxID=88074 RepID=UPI003794CEC3
MTENATGAPAGSWPAVSAEVVAEVVSALSERLRKRLDGAAAKLAARPVVRTGDEWTVRIDEEAVLILRAPGGTVRAAADVRCTCLLAPGCLHRAAAVTAAPLAEPETEPETETGTGGGAEPPPAPAAPAAPDAGTAQEPLTPAEAEAVHRLRRAAAHTLAAGISGAGSVVQAELLRTAHQARLLGLHRPAALATTVVTRLRAARAAEPDHRLADLAAGLRCSRSGGFVAVGRTVAGDAGWPGVIAGGARGGPRGRSRAAVRALWGVRTAGPVARRSGGRGQEAEGEGEAVGRGPGPPGAPAPSLVASGSTAIVM